MSTTPIPTPPKKANPVWWILAALIVLVGIGGLLVATHVARDVFSQVWSSVVKSILVKETRSGKKVEISTPVGDIRVSQGPGKDTTGLPVYPGALPAESAAKVEVSVPGEKQVGVAVAKYQTSDSLEKVEQWYRAHLSADFKLEQHGRLVGSARLKGFHTEEYEVGYVSEQGDLARVVALKRVGTGSEIALVRAGERETQ